MTEPLLKYDELKLRIEDAGRDSAGRPAYRVAVLAPDGSSESDTFTNPFSDAELDQFVSKVNRPRAASRGHRGRTANMEEARKLGGSLFNAAFPPKICAVYAAARKVAESRNRGLRVAICLTGASELMGHPWEYLYEDPDFLSQSIRTPVVRSLDLPTAPHAYQVTPPLRILGIVSSPYGLPELNVGAEKKKLEDALDGLATAGKVELSWLPRATLEDLEAYISAPDEVHVLHFIGHGQFDKKTGQGSLAFEGRDRPIRMVTGDDLSSMLVDERSLRLVVLNACEGARTSHADPFSGVATSILQRGIPAVIGMQFEITDKAAVCFADRFYTALARGLPIDAALAQSRRAIFAAGRETEFGTPVLFLRGKTTTLFRIASGKPPALPQPWETPLEKPGSEAGAAGPTLARDANPSGEQPSQASAKPDTHPETDIGQVRRDEVTPPGSRLRKRLYATAAAGLVVVIAAGALVIANNRGASLSESPTTASPTPLAPSASGPSSVLTNALITGSTGVWQSLPSLSEGVVGDTTFQMPNGRVVVFSSDTNGVPSRSSWWVDVASARTQAGPQMAFPQRIPCVTRMDDGSLLVAGGWLEATPLSSVEILSATTGQWIPATPMETPRSQAVMVNLGSGRFLAAGGWIAHNSDGGWTATSTAEIYDSNRGTWSYTGSMATPRALASATRLKDGRVLVAGGDQRWVGSSDEFVLASAELFDPKSGTWSPAGRMSSARSAHFAALLPNGQVLVLGGWSDGRERGSATVDVYDPASGWWRTSDMPDGRAQGRIVTLSDGRLMVVGGLDATGSPTSAVEIFDPATSAWTLTTTLPAAVYWPGAVVLKDGRVLVAGGSTGNLATARLLLFNPPPR